jgi:transposase-like protein
MPKGHKVTPQDAIRAVRGVQAVVATGRSVEEACRETGVAVNCYYRWRNLYAGQTVDEAVQAAQLRQENAQLRRLVADMALRMRALEDVARGKP